MTAALVKELGELLNSDVPNQREHGRVVEMRRLYIENPEAFVRRYLIPTGVSPAEMGPSNQNLLPTELTIPEKGFFTLTTR
jgi:hypothetical protein